MTRRQGAAAHKVHPASPETMLKNGPDTTATHDAGMDPFRSFPFLSLESRGLCEGVREGGRESAVTLFGSHAPMRSEALLACACAAAAAAADVTSLAFGDGDDDDDDGGGALVASKGVTTGFSVDTSVVSVAPQLHFVVLVTSLSLYGPSDMLFPKVTIASK